jgi:ribosomal peptide maturation radical SAM protein 1
MPWPIFNRPSIQLGSLQSYLNQYDGVEVESHHPYLDIAKAIGLNDYREIALSGWAGEALFAPLVFPEMGGNAKRLFKESFEAGNPLPARFESLAENIESSCKNYLDALSLENLALAGFSICFSQLLPSIYMAREIKLRSRKTKVVFGGSSCSGNLGKSLLDHFPEIDFTIDGEGEETLYRLYSFLSGETSTLPPQVSSREDIEIEQKSVAPLDLNTLPVPDFHNYFSHMRRLFPGQPFIPELPIEFSRGCWWNKCSFCNLNLQWHNYRHKSGAKMVSETKELVNTHESLSFTFTDNALPPVEADHFFEDMSQSGIDLDFFAEIRSIQSRKRLKLYKNGGLNTVQVGIEALSTSLLKKLKKGTSTIENIAVMKICSELKIELQGNLIVEFPSTTKEDVAETLHNLEYVLPFAPLDTATFFLGYGSPVHAECKKFGIQAVLPHGKNRQLFPKEYIQSMQMLLYSYRGDRGVQKKMWKTVRDKVAEWKLFHKSRGEKKRSALSYRDGGTFIVIRQEQLKGAPLQHRLRGLSREIYLTCESIISRETLYKTFPQIKQDTLNRFLLEMARKRLLFLEDDKFLALAVRINS